MAPWRWMYVCDRPVAAVRARGGHAGWSAGAPPSYAYNGGLCPRFLQLGNFSGNSAHSNLLYGFRIHPGLVVSTEHAMLRLPRGPRPLPQTLFHPHTVPAPCLHLPCKAGCLSQLLVFFRRHVGQHPACTDCLVDVHT